MNDAIDTGLEQQPLADVVDHIGSLDLALLVASVKAAVLDTRVELDVESVLVCPLRCRCHSSERKGAVVREAGYTKQQ